jgi:hypothetical protein
LKIHTKNRYLGKHGVRQKVYDRPIGLLLANHKFTNQIYIMWRRKKKSMDGEFQESKFIDEEFRHEDVEDPSQGFVDWDSPPTYDDDVNEKDQIEEP